MSTVILGFDVGLSGAMALLDGNRVEVIDLPLMEAGKGNSIVRHRLDPAAIAKELRRISAVHLELCAAVERVHAMKGQGVAGVFSLGDSFGCIRSVLAALKIPVEFVTPQAWKKHFHLDSDKEQARAKAIELYPGVDLHRKKDHGRAEALLIARWYLDTSS